MSDQNNNNGNSRLDRIEANIEAFSQKIQELVHAQMRSEAKAEKEMSEIRRIQENTQKHLDHLTQLVRFFGDKSFEFDGKVKQVGEILLEEKKNIA